jgi:hypothetical protein
MSSRRSMSEILSSGAHYSAKTSWTSQVMISQALVCKIHTLCTPLVCEMRVGAAAGLPNSWPSWLWIRQLSDPLLSWSPFLHAPKAFCFFPLFFSLYQIHFSKKQNFRKVIFWILPIPMKISSWTVVLWNIMQFPMDISVMDTGKYRNWCSPAIFADLGRVAQVYKKYMF